MADLLGLKHKKDVVRVVPRREREKWTSFEGVTKSICDLDDQHLCNIYYFMKFINPKFYNKHTRELIAREIDFRFDGNIMDYRPLRRLPGEIEILREKGMLRQDAHTNTTYVVFEGKVIGSVLEE